jgi:hypothetical protein
MFQKRISSGKLFREVIFFETLKDTLVVFLDYFTHFSAGTPIRR